MYTVQSGSNVSTVEVCANPAQAPYATPPNGVTWQAADFSVISADPNIASSASVQVTDSARGCAVINFNGPTSIGVHDFSVVIQSCGGGSFSVEDSLEVLQSSGSALSMSDSNASADQITMGIAAPANTGITLATQGSSGTVACNLIDDAYGRFEVGAASAVVSTVPVYPPAGSLDASQYVPWDLYDGTSCPMTDIYPKRYIDPVGGNNANDGLTMATAYQTIPTGNIGGFEWIYKDGTYTDLPSFEYVLTTAHRNTTASDWCVIRPETKHGVQVISNQRTYPFVKTAQDANEFKRLIVWGFSMSGFQNGFLITRGGEDIRVLDNIYEHLGAPTNGGHFTYIGYTQNVAPFNAARRIECSYNKGVSQDFARGAFLHHSSNSGSTNEGLRGFVLHHNYTTPGSVWTHGIVLSPDGGGDGLIFNNTMVGSFTGTPMTFGSYGGKGQDSVILRSNIFDQENPSSSSGLSGAVGFWGNSAQLATNISADATNTMNGGQAVEQFVGSPVLTSAQLGDFRDPQLSAASIPANAAEQGSGSPLGDLPVHPDPLGNVHSALLLGDRGAFHFGPTFSEAEIKSGAWPVVAECSDDDETVSQNFSVLVV